MNITVNSYFRRARPELVQSSSRALPFCCLFQTSFSARFAPAEHNWLTGLLYRRGLHVGTGGIEAAASRTGQIPAREHDAIARFKQDKSASARVKVCCGPTSSPAQTLAISRCHSRPIQAESCARESKNRPNLARSFAHFRQG